MVAIEDFLSGSKRIGALLRTYSPDFETVRGDCLRMENTVEWLLNNLRVRNEYPIKKVLILVWRDDSFRDHRSGNLLSDCGETAPILRRHFSQNPRVEVREVSRGDIYCTVLNQGVAALCRQMFDYALIISKEAVSYALPDTMEAMLELITRGARVVGVAIEEIRDLVLQGAVSNTFAMWDIASLLHVGGFDMRDALPRRQSQQESYHVRDSNGEAILDAGLGVVIPTARMINEFGGQPIGIVVPPAGGAYETSGNPERNEKKFRTKKIRLKSILDRAGYNLKYLQQGVIR